MKIKKHIEIVRTSTKYLSSMSERSALKIQTALSKYYETVGISVVNNFVDLEVVVRSNPDLVFLGLKRMESGIPNTSSYSEVWMADYFEQHDIRYTGSRAAAIKLDYDKAKAKAIVAEAGIHTAGYFTTQPGEYKSAAALPLKFPLFVKPVSKGGGTGIDSESVVRTFAQFEHKVASIYEDLEAISLVETYLEGREFTVAILDTYNASEPLVMPIEITTEKNKRGDRILGSQVKVDDHEVVSAVNDSRLKNDLNLLATTVYALLGGRDLGRIDIRMDAEGVPHFLEANFAPAPGTRYFAGAGKITKDIDYETILLKIISPGLSRPQKKRLPLAEDISEASVEPILDTVL